LDISGYVEEGGVVTSIRTAAGAVVSASGASIVGTVTDSLGTPFPGAHVSIIGTDLETITDPSGVFRLDDIRAGTWSVSASHPELLAYGHPGSRAQVSVGSSGTGRADLQLTSVAAASADRCRGSPSVPGETAILIGRVVRPDGRPAPRADVRAVWTIPRGAYRRTLEGFGTTADEAGAFTLCGIPVDRVVVARATGEGGATGTAEVRVPSSADVAPIVIDLENGSAPAGGVTTAVTEDRDDEAAWLGAIGFDLRAGHALLHLDRSAIAATGHDRLEEILDDVPRLEVRRLVTGDSELRLHPSPGVARRAEDESCPLDVYLNGSLVQYRGAGVGLQTTLQPRYVTAIEVHDAAYAPVGSADACGVVLLWLSLLRQADDPGFSGAIRGRVLGPSDAAGAGAITLRLRPGDLYAMVDAQGRFDFGPVAPAPYTMEATVPNWGILSTPVDVRAGYALDLVVDRVVESIDLAPRSDAAATLGGPSPEEAREALCSAQEPGSAMVMGRVLDGRTGEPVAGVSVDVRWAFSPGLMDWTDVRRDFSTLVGVTTDERGVYLVCGVPAPSSVRMAVRGAALDDWLSVDVVKRDVVVRDLTVR
jgi:protocatechuate 3,4-dioxygenase beta subunit